MNAGNPPEETNAKTSVYNTETSPKHHEGKIQIFTIYS